jgi:hypothetical protein
MTERVVHGLEVVETYVKDCDQRVGLTRDPRDGVSDAVEEETSVGESSKRIVE